VRAAVQVAQPSSEVFEVSHTGYVVLQHQQHPRGGSRRGRRGGSWRLLSQPGETGVLWFDEDGGDEESGS
jgi:hypothetical protein